MPKFSKKEPCTVRVTHEGKLVASFFDSYKSLNDCLNTMTRVVPIQYQKLVLSVDVYQGEKHWHLYIA
jgi:hypothetical protein